MALIPEERYVARQQAREWRRRASSIYVKAALVIYGAILMLLFMMYRDAQHSVWQGFLNCFIVVLFIMATVGLFVKSRWGGEHDPRPLDLGRMERRGLEKLIGYPTTSPGADASVPPEILPPGQTIDDLSELPPSLAANPEFQKLFRDAKALGGSIRVSVCARGLALAGPCRSIRQHPQRESSKSPKQCIRSDCCCFSQSWG